MVKLELKDPLHIQINTENISYLTGLREFFSAYVEGYNFMPQFQFGGWNGKVCLFNSSNRTLPYGLITDLIRYTKKDFPLEQIDVDPNISSLFKCVENPKITQKLKFKLRPYQTDCVLTALKYGRGIIKVATASGKSFIIANIINELKVLGKIKKSLIIVPTTNLVQQFRDDLIDYGFDVSRIGRLYSEFKELNNEILISTWQSLMTRHEILKNYDCVIGDECLDGETLIKTTKGMIPIKQIKKGDMVISYNINNKKYEQDIVNNVYKNISKNEKMYELEFDNGKKIKITGNHKILTKNGYIRADELTKNDEIISLL